MNTEQLGLIDAQRRSMRHFTQIEKLRANQETELFDWRESSMAECSQTALTGTDALNLRREKAQQKFAEVMSMVQREKLSSSTGILRSSVQVYMLSATNAHDAWRIVDDAILRLQDAVEELRIYRWPGGFRVRLIREAIKFGFIASVITLTIVTALYLTPIGCFAPFFTFFIGACTGYLVAKYSRPFTTRNALVAGGIAGASSSIGAVAGHIAGGLIYAFLNPPVNQPATSATSAENSISFFAGAVFAACFCGAVELVFMTAAGVGGGFIHSVYDKASRASLSK